MLGIEFEVERVYDVNSFRTLKYVLKIYSSIRFSKRHKTIGKPNDLTINLLITILTLPLNEVTLLKITRKAQVIMK